MKFCITCVQKSRSFNRIDNICKEDIGGGISFRLSPSIVAARLREWCRVLTSSDIIDKEIDKER